MAIIIPSKHIYSKNFDPVIDNNIDKVEVNASSPKTIDDYNTIVYSNDYIVNASQLESYTQNNIDSDVFIQSPQGGNDPHYSEVVAYIQEKANFYTINVQFPKESKNELIKKVYTGLNGNGYPYIGASATYSKSEYSIQGQLNITGSSANVTADKVSINENSALLLSTTTESGEINTGYKQTDRYDTGITKEVFDTENKNIIGTYTVVRRESTGAILNPYRELSAIAETEIENLSTVASAKILEENGYYKATLKILAGKQLTLLKCINMGAANANALTSEDRKMTGNRIAYIPNKISVTIYGDTIKLNINDIVKQIGYGNKTYSFEGNELIQTTNTPSIESKYQSIIDSWKNGKQTAIISCPIADYYDYDRPIEIEVYAKNDSTRYSIHLYEQTDLHYQDDLYYENEKASILTGIQNLGNGVWACVISVVEGGQFANMLNKGKFVVNMKSPPVGRLTFDIGDTVIPYTYTNQGDKPISYNKDFTPKQFTVIGTKISKKQGVTQELTLQEV